MEPHEFFEYIVAIPSEMRIPLLRYPGDFAVFNNGGFYFSDLANHEYQPISDLPHIYIVYRKTHEGWYVGKSNQQGGRWKRSNYYHLRMLSNPILGIDMNLPHHQNWAATWFGENPHTAIEENHFQIQKLEEIFIAFFPFENKGNYVNEIEGPIINDLIGRGILLLNNHHNPIV